MLVGTVINKIRAAQGWNLLPPDQTFPLASAWIELFAEHKIKPSEINELYKRAADRRIAMLRAGKEPPAFTVELLIACHPEMLRERREKDVSANYFLPETAQAACELCNGYGFEPYFDESGYQRSRKCSNGCQMRRSV